MLFIRCLLKVTETNYKKELRLLINQKENSQNPLDPNPKVSQQDLKVVYNVDYSYTSKVAHINHNLCQGSNIKIYVLSSRITN
jgi:hypothetical protein